MIHRLLLVAMIKLDTGINTNQFLNFDSFHVLDCHTVMGANNSFVSAFHILVPMHLLDTLLLMKLIHFF